MSSTSICSNKPIKRRKRNVSTVTPRHIHFKIDLYYNCMMSASGVQPKRRRRSRRTFVISITRVAAGRESHPNSSWSTGAGRTCLKAQRRLSRKFQLGDTGSAGQSNHSNAIFPYMVYIIFIYYNSKWYFWHLFIRYVPGTSLNPDQIQIQKDSDLNSDP